MSFDSIGGISQIQNSMHCSIQILWPTSHKRLVLLGFFVNAPIFIINTFLFVLPLRQFFFLLSSLIFRKAISQSVFFILWKNITERIQIWSYYFNFNEMVRMFLCKKLLHCSMTSAFFFILCRQDLTFKMEQFLLWVCHLWVKRLNTICRFNVIYTFIQLLVDYLFSICEWQEIHDTVQVLHMLTWLPA